jgi:hypothetical protein
MENYQDNSSKWLTSKGLRPAEVTKVFELLTELVGRDSTGFKWVDKSDLYYKGEQSVFISEDHIGSDVDRCAWKVTRVLDIASLIYEEADNGSVVILYKEKPKTPEQEALRDSWPYSVHIVRR